MKILAIRGKNLASLEGEFNIDFRTEPLNSAGLFAITGPTGSGKTTILDAMCIALYEKAPRLDNVKNKVDKDDKSRHITNNSAKTFLRRGAGDGYAEVDFIAVNGNEYRARWSVSRKRKGSKTEFSNASYDLFNLCTGEYTSYSKAQEYKDTITSLVGLTYQQFTRAVLLAQGNFSAFLKAEENEKGMILQALTGTDIYSRISGIIYARCKQAKSDLELIESKRNALSIKSQEEVTLLAERKKTLAQEQEILNKSLQELTAKKNWLERNRLLTTELSEATLELNIANEALNSAAGLIVMLQKVDSLQEIRDTYASFCHSERVYSDSERDITVLKEEIKKHDSELRMNSESLEKITSEQENINSQWLKMRPIIIQSTRLEEKLSFQEEELNKLMKESKQLVKEFEIRKQERERLKENISCLKNETKKIDEWFSQNKQYEQALPYIPSIVVNIRTAQNDKEQAAHKELMLDNAEKLLKTNTVHLEEARRREEKLNATLSNEIASLREKLVEGEPCPVCGSRHHHIDTHKAETIAQAELEREKEDIKAQIEFLENSIENGKREIATLQSAIKIHKDSVCDMQARNIEFLNGIENPQELLENRNVITILDEILNCWNSFKERSLKLSEELAVKNTALSATESRITESEEAMRVKDELITAIINSIGNTKNEIKENLGGFSTAKDAQEHFEKLIADKNKEYSIAAEREITIAGTCNRLKGQLAEKEKSLYEERERQRGLAKIISESLERRNDSMSISEMKELLSIGADTIAANRNKIESLRNNFAKADATRQERERKIAEHRTSPDKPAENEDASTLQHAIEKVNGKNRELMEESANISAEMMKDEENRRLFADYEVEYLQKKEDYTAWSDLDNKFGSANGEKLMRLVQGYTLDILLNIANIHLKEMTGRYELARVSEDFLAIEVIDLDMLSERRSIHSLSGGETFLVSLALALALSSISSNRMSIESLFIDEGFGALDIETLKIVMGALEKLQSQGRKIGVISHLKEMLEMIPVKIVVEKRNSGMSRIKIES